VVVDGDLQTEAVDHVDRHDGEDDPGQAQTANREDQKRKREVQLPLEGERPVGAVQGVEGAREERVGHGQMGHGLHGELGAAEGGQPEGAGGEGDQEQHDDERDVVGGEQP
jgi:hypothetical protein